MAVNEKVIRATRHVSHGRRIFRPGEQINGEKGMPDYAIRASQEQGYASDVAAHGDAARKAEGERRERVAAEQKSRSIPREHNKRD
jgi:hypothetical protein